MNFDEVKFEKLLRRIEILEKEVKEHKTGFKLFNDALFEMRKVIGKIVAKVGL